MLYRFLFLFVFIVSTAVSQAAAGSDQWTHYNTNSGLSDNFVTSISEDGKGNIWAGTWKGICVLKKGTDKWTSYDSSKGLSGDKVTSIACNENIWAGILSLSSRGGVAMIDSQDRIKNITLETGLPSEAVTSVAVAENGKIWIGTWDSGIAVFDSKAWKVEKIFNSTNGLPSNNIVSIFVDGTRVWAGTKYSGLALWNDNKWTVFSEHTSGLRNNAVHSISKTRKDYWFGTWAGAFSISIGKDLGDYKNWHEYTDFMSRLADRFVRVIEADNDNRVWFGTDRGLSMFDGNLWITYTSTCKRITSYDVKTRKWHPKVMSTPSIISNTVLDVLVDRANKLWVATDRGISCLQLPGVNDQKLDKRRDGESKQ
jgi:ligand-binding sensor domain-containing protein